MNIGLHVIRCNDMVHWTEYLFGIQSRILRMMTITNKLKSVEKRNELAELLLCFSFSIEPTIYNPLSKNPSETKQA